MTEQAKVEGKGGIEKAREKLKRQGEKLKVRETGSDRCRSRPRPGNNAR